VKKKLKKCLKTVFGFPIAICLLGLGLCAAVLLALLLGLDDLLGRWL